MTEKLKQNAEQYAYRLYIVSDKPFTFKGILKFVSDNDLLAYNLGCCNLRLGLIIY